jgi:hypothetical protein
MAHLVDDTVPCVAGVVDDDVDLTAAKLRRLRDQLVDVLLFQQVTRHSEGLAAGGVDAVCRGARLFGVNVGHDDFGALLGEQPRALGADALRGAGDDGHLAGQQAAGPEMTGDLGSTLCHRCYVFYGFRLLQ